MVVGTMWKAQPSVYGPFATVIQSFAASIGHANVATTIWVLMILNGIVFIGVGLLLLVTSDDPVRATLFWTANPVLILELVSGGHLDTLVAAAAIGAIQVARRFSTVWGDAVVGVLIGLACGVKIYAVLIGLGLAFPAAARPRMAAHHPDDRGGRGHARAQLRYFGLGAIRPVFGGLKLVTLPSPWRVFELTGQAFGVPQNTMATIISCLWPFALFIVAWLVYRRISSDQPAEVVAPFALTFAWILVAPWVFAWYTAVAWAALTQVPRNRMTRWLTIVTVLLASVLVQRRPRRPDHVTALPVPADAGPADRRAARWRACLGRAGRGGTGWRRPAGRRPGAAGAGPARLPARAVLHRLRCGTCTTPRAWTRSATRGRCGPSCSWATSTRSPRSSICSAWPWPWSSTCCCCAAACPAGWPRWPSRRVLLDAYQLQNEQTIMPGTWFEALIVAGLAILLWRPRPGLAAPSSRRASCWAPRPRSPRSARP